MEKPGKSGHVQIQKISFSLSYWNIFDAFPQLLWKSLVRFPTEAELDPKSVNPSLDEEGEEKAEDDRKGRL